MKIHDFRIADFNIRLFFSEDGRNDMSLLPSFATFAIDTISPNDDLLFTFTIDDNLKPIEKSKRTRIRAFDTGNGDTIVDEVAGGGYQFIIKDLEGRDCCLFQGNADFSECKCALNGNRIMRTFGLNNALMMAFAFSSGFHQTVLMHASVIMKKGWGYAFTAVSGTGKSTHTSLWLKHIPGAELLNDDNPIIRVIDGEAYIYGAPWSGKTPCYRNMRTRLGAISLIVRDTKNYLEKMPTLQAYTTLLPSVSSMRWDGKIFDNVCNNVGLVMEKTDVYSLHCLPNKEAAVICHDTIAKE